MSLLIFCLENRGLLNSLSTIFCKDSARRIQSNLLELLSRSQSSAKILQGEYNQTCLNC